MEGLIAEAMLQLQEETGEPEITNSLREAQKNISDTWTDLFSTDEYPIDRNQPLTTKILRDPYHPVTGKLIYSYSIESYVYRTVNEANRNADKSKVPPLGPF